MPLGSVTKVKIYFFWACARKPQEKIKKRRGGGRGKIMKKEFCFCFLSFFLFHLFSFCSTTTTTTTTTTKQQRPVQRLSLGRRRPESRRTRGFGFGRTSRLCQQRPLAVAFVVVGMLLSGRRVCTCFGRKEPVSDEQQQQHRAPLFFVRDKCNSVGPESTSAAAAAAEAAAAEAAAAAAAAAARRRRRRRGRRRPGRSRLGPRCLLRRGFPLSLVR